MFPQFKGNTSGFVWIESIFCSTPEDDQCVAAKMVEIKEPLIYLKHELKQFTNDLQNNSHAADVVTLTEYILKYYGPNRISSIFSSDASSLSEKS